MLGYRRALPGAGVHMTTTTVPICIHIGEVRGRLLTVTWDRFWTKILDASAQRSFDGPDALIADVKRPRRPFVSIIKSRVSRASAGLQPFRMYCFCKTDGGPVEALSHAGLRGPPTLQNALFFLCRTDGGPMEALLDAGLREPPTLQNV